jgi:hypothetical protein
MSETMSEERETADCSLRARIERAATEALDGFPSESACERQPDDTARFLTQARSLLKEGTSATSWDDDQVESYVARLSWGRLGFEAGLGHGLGVSGANEPSCTFKCKSERDRCIRNDCGTGTSWPCFCCAPCNATWMACLADCII